MDKIASVDAYINQLTVDQKNIITTIRSGIQQRHPEAIEKLSYQMPSFKYKKHFVYYGAFKKHIGLYPPLTDNLALIEKTSPYRNAKGNLMFQYEEVIPYDLIFEVVDALSEQYN